MNLQRSNLFMRLIVIIAVLAVTLPGQAQAAPTASACVSVAGTVYWHVDSSWSCTTGAAARQPVIDDDVIILGSTLMLVTEPTIGRANSVTINGTLALGSNVTLVVFNDLIISTGGSFQGGAVNSTVQMTWGNLTVQPGGTLTPGGSAWLWVAPSVHTISGSPTLASLNVYEGAMLDLGTGNLTVNGTVTNNGIISATRTIAAAGAYTFGLAGGPINAANLSLNVTDDQFTSITIGRHDTNHPNRTGADATKGAGWGTYWTITPVGTGTVDVTLPTTFAPDANDTVCRYTGTGTTWDCARTTNTSNTITRNGVTTFSDWAAGNEVGPTAIALNTFEAQAAPDNSAVGWLLALLGVFTLGGLWLMRKAAQR